MIQEHLYADHLCRRAADSKALAREIQEPLNQPFALAAVCRQKSAKEVREILFALPQPNLLEMVFHGKAGRAAAKLVKQDCHRLLSDAAADLATLRVELDVDVVDGKRTLVKSPRLEGCRKWTPYEAGLAWLVGRKVESEDFASRTAELFAFTGSSLWAASELAARGTGFKATGVFDYFIHHNFICQSSEMKCAASWIFHGGAHFFAPEVWPTGEIVPDGAWTRALMAQVPASPTRVDGITIMALCDVLYRAGAAETTVVDHWAQVLKNQGLGDA
jgi:hypothetical protein